MGIYALKIEWEKWVRGNDLSHGRSDFAPLNKYEVKILVNEASFSINYLFECYYLVVTLL